MNATEEIEVIISPEGQVQVKVRGVDGPGCLELTEELERYLGGRVIHRQETDEFRKQGRRDEQTVR